MDEPGDTNDGLMPYNGRFDEPPAPSNGSFLRQVKSYAIE